MGGYIGEKFFFSNFITLQENRFYNESTMNKFIKPVLCADKDYPERDKETVIG